MVLKQPKKASPASAKTTGKRLIDNLKYGYILFKRLADGVKRTSLHEIHLYDQHRCEVFLI